MGCTADLCGRLDAWAAAVLHLPQHPGTLAAGLVHSCDACRGILRADSAWHVQAADKAAEALDALDLDDSTATLVNVGQLQWQWP